jgi:hypothetical protein
MYKNISGNLIVSGYEESKLNVPFVMMALRVLQLGVGGELTTPYSK